MFQGTVGDGKTVSTRVFNVVVDVEEGGPPNDIICQKLVDSLLWVEGIGKVDASLDFHYEAYGKENDPSIRQD